VFDSDLIAAPLEAAAPVEKAAATGE
jgi:hypothetical protein